MQTAVINLGNQLSPRVQEQLLLAATVAQSRRHGDCLRSFRAVSTLEPGDPVLGYLRPTTVMMADPRSGAIYCNDRYPREWESPQGLLGYTDLTNPAHYQLAGILDHEMGHLMTARFSAKKLRRLYTALGPTWISQNISLQATRSFREFVAEAYALLQTDYPVSEAVLGCLRPAFRS
jgi:hypothetical protein